MGLFRMLFFGLGAYLLIVLTFPDWRGSSYHVISIGMIVGGAAAVHVTLNMMKVASLVSILLFELAFVGLAVLYLAYTLPTDSGKPPVQQWAEGHKPTRDTARATIERVGIDPKWGPAKLLIKAFPK